MCLLRVEQRYIRFDHSVGKILFKSTLSLFSNSISIKQPCFLSFLLSIDFFISSLERNASLIQMNVLRNKLTLQSRDLSKTMQTRQAVLLAPYHNQYNSQKKILSAKFQSTVNTNFIIQSYNVVVTSDKFISKKYFISRGLNKNYHFRKFCYYL